MSDKGDKGNPLDRLTRPGGRPISDDESIPILTERLTLPSLDLDISLPKAPPAAEAAPPPPPPAPPPPPPPPARPSAPRATARAPEPTPTPRAAASSVAIPTYSSSATAPTEVAAVPAAAAEVDWTAFEVKLREAVFRELQPALADEAGRLLRERLQPAFERAVLATTAELRQAFDTRLREAIARAVAAEVARQRSRG